MVGNVQTNYSKCHVLYHHQTTELYQLLSMKIKELGKGKQTAILYAFFWVIPRRLEFICRRFGTLCLFHLRRQVDVGI